MLDRRFVRGGWCAASAIIVVIATVHSSLAGTTGRLSGLVTDPQKQPLAGANVILVGVPLGAATDMEGRFTILNIPAGTYSVKASLIGHTSTTVTDVQIPADRLTTLNIVLQESALELEEVVVSGERPIVDLNLTSNIATLSREQISRLPVQELQDLVNLQAGVVEGHFRGGRLGEVQYQVDGVTANNLYDNQVAMRLDRSVLEEVQVISGTFDAEYGQAMSGVVNAVLRRGSDRFQWSGEVFSGAFYFPTTDRVQDFEFNPGGIQNYQLTLSGPTGLPNTHYLVNGRRYLFDDYLRGVRLFVPSDRRDSVGGYHPSGNQEEVIVGQYRETSGLIKLTSHAIPKVELSYQAVINDREAQRTDPLFVINPDGLSTQNTFSISHGFDWSHAVSQTSYYKLSLRQNYFEYTDHAYEDLYDPRYDEAGGLAGNQDVAYGAYTEGVDFARFKQTTNAPVLAGSFSSLRRNHFWKLGGDVQHPLLEFGNQGHLVYNQEGGVETLIRYEDQPPDYPGVSEYHPWLWNAYVQDDAHLSDLRIRAGLRLEYFDPVSSLPGDLANPANSIAGAPAPPPEATSRKYSLMPRIGISYPVTPSASVFFAYGHFTQMPPLRDVFGNSDYSVLATLQAGQGDRFGILGNPDIEPERTVHYQFGYKQVLPYEVGLDMTVFYKDIRDLLGLEFVSTYNDAEYVRFTNVDFGSVLGFTVALDQRKLGWFAWTLDYTYQQAQGNSSDPRETATQIEQGADPRPRSVPLNWDQRHTLNLSLEFARPNRFVFGGILRAASGQPYTPTLGLGGFGSGLEANSGRKPPAFVVDLRGEIPFRVGGVQTSLFGRVFNLFDTRYFNGFVFGSTGSPYYGVLVDEETREQDPTRYYPPRRIELGFTFAGGGFR